MGYTLGAPAPGTRLGGRYRLLERIGAGSMATVFRARDEFLNRDVAVKIVRTAPTDETGQRRNDDEVKVLARLNHHTLITLLDAGTDLQNPQTPLIYLVMELISGPDLRQRLAQGRLSDRHTAQIGYDLADGLEYIHGHGIVHRDVKPANVLVFDYRQDQSRVRAKLTDFGIAQMTAADISAGDAYSGTAGYLSPEQARGEPVGPPSDVYSLGLVLLQCLTGVQPYPGPALESALARLLRQPHIPVDLDQPWISLLTAMTALDPSNRPNSQQVSRALYEIAAAQRPRHRVEASLLPENEAQRLAAVRELGILDTPPDGAFDRVTALAARLFSVPIAIVSVVDHDRIWFKSHHGLDIDEIDRDPGLCASAILQTEPWILPDAAKDPRSLANPLVASGFGLRFYAGVPLRTRNGFNLGTLCILDRSPREFSAADTEILKDLADIVMDDLHTRWESRSMLSRQPFAPVN